jgi:hypothetical protein
VLYGRSGYRHSASLRAFTPVFDGLWTRVNALMAHPGYALIAARALGGKNVNQVRTCALRRNRSQHRRHGIGRAQAP